MKWIQEISEFIDSIYQKGVRAGHLQEHTIKKKTCKYFRRQGAYMWSDGCYKLKAVCDLDTCPANEEAVRSVRTGVSTDD